MTLEQMLGEIIAECSNGCTDARSTYEHFEKLTRFNIITLADMQRVKLWAGVLNYAAIREAQDALWSDLKTPKA
jgi:hypothetical protein